MSSNLWDAPGSALHWLGMQAYAHPLLTSYLSGPVTTDDKTYSWANHMLPLVAQPLDSFVAGNRAAVNKPPAAQAGNTSAGTWGVDPTEQAIASTFQPYNLQRPAPIPLRDPREAYRLSQMPYAPGGPMDQAAAEFHQSVAAAQGAAGSAWNALQGAMNEPMAQISPYAAFAQRLAGGLSSALSPRMGGQQLAEQNIMDQNHSLQQRQMMRMQLMEKHADILAERAMRLGDTEAANKWHTKAQAASEGAQAIADTQRLNVGIQEHNQQMQQTSDLAQKQFDEARLLRTMQYNLTMGPQTGIYYDYNTGKQIHDTTGFMGKMNAAELAKQYENVATMKQRAADGKNINDAHNAVATEQALDALPRVGEKAQNWWNRVTGATYSGFHSGTVSGWTGAYNDDPEAQSTQIPGASAAALQRYTAGKATPSERRTIEAYLPTLAKRAIRYFGLDAPEKAAERAKFLQDIGHPEYK